MNPAEDDARIGDLLRSCRTVAVVGLSRNPARPSHEVAAYLQRQGYRVVPVNPRYPDVLGEKCYPDLTSIPFAVDLIDVFRRADEVPSIASEAVTIGARVLWLQLGVVSEAARRIAEAGGLRVVMDRCVKIEHVRLLAAGS